MFTVVLVFFFVLFDQLFGGDCFLLRHFTPGFRISFAESFEPCLLERSINKGFGVTNRFPRQAFDFFQIGTTDTFLGVIGDHQRIAGRIVGVGSGQFVFEFGVRSVLGILLPHFSCIDNLGRKFSVLVCARFWSTYLLLGKLLGSPHELIAVVI